MFKRIFLVVLALFGLNIQAQAEDSLQKQVEDLKAQVQYIKDNYERSEPVEIVKPVTEFVSPSGEIFMTPQKDGVSPNDGSKLEERVTYRKMKFNRRESVGDKIDSAIEGAMDGRVFVGMELLGLYQNTVGAGDVLDATGQTRNANRGTGTGGVNVNFSGKPMRNSVMFVDLDAASGSVALGEAWLSVAGPKSVLSLQTGLLDIAGSFDSNKVANDETAQFLSDIFVNSPLLGNPSGLGAIVRADFTRYNFAVGTQDTKGSSSDVFDDLYWIAEAGMRYNLLGDGHLRVWVRQQPRGHQQPDQAMGTSYDHRLTQRLTAFGRYSKNSYVESYTPEDLANLVTESRVAINTLDWSASGGLELGYFHRKRLNDKVGLGYGRTDQQGGASDQYAEAYYKLHLTGNLSASLHGQGNFSRLVASSDPALLDPNTIDPATGLPGNPALNDASPNAWTASIRVLASY